MRDMNSQEEVEQWEALDLGDSELPSFLRPCKRKSPSRSLQPPTPQQNPPKAGFSSNTNRLQILNRCSSSRDHSLIPGPAGTVQVAIRRKMNKDPRSFNENGEPIPTQDFIRKSTEEPDWEDKDFSEDPWISAVDYIQSEGLLSNGGNAIGTPVSEIKRGCGNWGKINQVVAVIKTSIQNGLGDVMVTLKDPTGTIDGSVHRKVISESEFGRDIRAGSVVILKQVAVCAPTRSSHYLNITLKNISKVFTKDTPVLPKQIESEASSKNPVNETEEVLRLQPKVYTVEQGTTQGILNNLRQNAKESSEAPKDVEMEETNPAEGSTGVVRMEQTLFGKHESISLTETDTADSIRPAKKICKSPEQHTDEKESVMENSKSQSMVSTSSAVPQWTDEQLEELFAFD